MSRSGEPGLVLAIDTCGGSACVALARGDRIVAESRLEGPRARADGVAGLVSDLFGSTRSSPDRLLGCGVTIGPGSFTGVRIGLSLVRGLTLPGLLGVFSMDSLELTARTIDPEPEHGALVCALAEAGAGRLYAAGFRMLREKDAAAAALEPVFEPRVSEIEHLRDWLCAREETWLLAGEGAALVADASAEAGSGLREIPCSRPRALVLAGAAVRALAHGETRPAEQVLPLYVARDRAKPNRNRVASVGGVASPR